MGEDRNQARVWGGMTGGKRKGTQKPVVVARVVRIAIIFDSRVVATLMDQSMAGRWAVRQSTRYSLVVGNIYFIRL
jgi:hypothetical protein